MRRNTPRIKIFLLVLGLFIVTLGVFYSILTASQQKNQIDNKNKTSIQKQHTTILNVFTISHRIKLISNSILNNE